MKTRIALLVSLLVLLLATSAPAYMKEGTAKGVVVTVGEGRVVIQADGGGQMTMEVKRIKDGEEWVKDRAQMAQLKTVKAGQRVVVRWGQDHTGHYTIVNLEVAGHSAAKARNGIARGTVVTSGGGRVVIEVAEGGQMTLEPHWIRRQGKFIPDPYFKAFTETIKQGDEIAAVWDLDEGTHYVVRGIAVAGQEGLALSMALTQAQLREAYNQINQLQNEIRGLRNLINQRLPAKHD